MVVKGESTTTTLGNSIAGLNSHIHIIKTTCLEWRETQLVPTYLNISPSLPMFTSLSGRGGGGGAGGEGRGGRKGGGEEGKGGGGGKKLFPPKLKILTHTVHTGVRTVPGSASINSRFIPIGGHSYLASPKLIYIYINFP